MWGRHATFSLVCTGEESKKRSYVSQSKETGKIMKMLHPHVGSLCWKKSVTEPRQQISLLSWSVSDVVWKQGGSCQRTSDEINSECYPCMIYSKRRGKKGIRQNGRFRCIGLLVPIMQFDSQVSTVVGWLKSRIAEIQTRADRNKANAADFILCF